MRRFWPPRAGWRKTHAFAARLGRVLGGLLVLLASFGFAPARLPSTALKGRLQLRESEKLCGRPLRVMGARTVSSDPTFRFINVRRLLCMVRVALDLSTRWAVNRGSSYGRSRTPAPEGP